MLRIIPRPLHAATDYLFAAALAASPSLVGFEEDDRAVLAARTFAGTTTTASLLTRYELGLIRIIPFNVHLILDVVSAFSLLLAPWVLEFSDNEKARNTFVGFGLLEIIAILLSKRDGDA